MLFATCFSDRLVKYNILRHTRDGEGGGGAGGVGGAGREGFFFVNRFLVQQIPDSRQRQRWCQG